MNPVSGTEYCGFKMLVSGAFGYQHSPNGWEPHGVNFFIVSRRCALSDRVKASHLAHGPAAYHTT